MKKRKILMKGKRMIKSLALLLVAGCSALAISDLQAQVTGGRSSFSFLNVSNSPHVTAMGTMAPASYARDVTLMLQNPALLNKRYHNQLSLSHNFYFAGINATNVSYANHSKKYNTDFGVSVQYFNYGKFNNTDEFGNSLGDIRASDFALNLTASRNYGTRWRYGATLKIANSHLGNRSAFALLADVGVVYDNPEQLLTFGIVAKNMGVTLKKYNPDNKAEPLPFDLQIGVMKGLKNIPLRVFAVAHHLYEWDIRYDDPANIGRDILGEPTEDPDKKHTVDKIFRHLNFGAELTLAKRVTATVAYSHLRRSELGVTNAKGLAGFSMGVGIDLNKLHVQFGRSYYGNAGAYNEVGLVLQLNKLMKAKGKLAARGWNDYYE